ncbi:MAG: cysteine desulfurase [Candidatus Marsarchaeota archaeon]|jgi:cysteine desulfurase/selenocysteine lyase|nr:cysteine desulfurase [Candidatus Marsarchaeota archaeon]
MQQGLDTKVIRKDFPILSTLSHGKPLVYLDSASTSQKPIQVIEAISAYYKGYNANIHRGLYEISVRATEAYTGSKDLVARFVNAASYRNIIYTRNTTESINLVARSWGEKNIGKGDRILITEMEHHSNIVPWQLLAQRNGAILDFVRLSRGSGGIDMDDLKAKLAEGPKMLAFTHASNVLGSITDAKKITELGHKAGAVVLVDGAQAAPHFAVDIGEINPDFYAFSGHKMLAPAGIGVLYGREELLEEMPPFLGGGDMIRSVDFKESTWNELPWKFEAGTPNIEGGIGLGRAIEYLNSAGMKMIRAHEVALTAYALERLSSEAGVTVYGPDGQDTEHRGGVISFNIKGAHPHDVATIFDSEGVAIRAGHHCAMPLVNKVLNEPSVARMSFYLYNNMEDVDRAVGAIAKVRKVLRLQKPR